MIQPNVIEQFADAMRAAGLEPPEDIQPGKLHRFPGFGRRNGNTVSWNRISRWSGGHE